MKAVPLLLFLAVTACAAEAASTRLFETSLQSRVGYDSNPLGTSGTSAALLGDDDTLTFAAGAGLGLTLAPATPETPTLKLTYAGEVVRFDRASEENFSTHRLGVNGQLTTGVWKFTGEGSTLLIAGSRETLSSVASINANAIPLWRDRRRQWQHRFKLQSQATLGACVLRATGTWLAYDYRTRVTAGKFAFADRSDTQAALDLGWKQKANSLWLSGIRVGRQNEEVVPLPNCEFDYSSNYYRLAAGWEGKPCANTTVTFTAGPDFRHYSGAIDSRVFLDGRNRTSLWLEGGFVSKLSPTLTLTGKAVQFDWLSSTGKSAYVESSVETAAAWNVTSAWTVRLSAKVHRCDYFPTKRDDWESLLGLGASWQLSPHSLLTMDLLGQRAWNQLAAFSEREFQRLTINLGATIKL